MSSTLALEQPLVVQLLLAQGLLKEEDLPEVQQAVNRHSGTVEEALVDAALATDADIAQVYADQLRLPLLDDETVLKLNKELTEPLLSPSPSVPQHLFLLSAFPCSLTLFC